MYQVQWLAISWFDLQLAISNWEAGRQGNINYKKPFSISFSLLENMFFYHYVGLKKAIRSKVAFYG